METVAYVFTDIRLLDSHNPYFVIKNGFKLLKEKVLEMIPNMEELKYKVSEKNNNI